MMILYRHRYRSNIAPCLVFQITRKWLSNFYSSFFSVAFNLSSNKSIIIKIKLWHFIFIKHFVPVCQNRWHKFKWSPILFNPLSADEYPVLAFTGAPAPYPVQPENIRIQKYFAWNDRINSRADDFVKTQLPKGPFVGIHLRNGVDWVRFDSPL